MYQQLRSLPQPMPSHPRPLIPPCPTKPGASAGILFLTGCWASLQFRFLPLQYPVLAHAAENIVLTATPPATAALLAIGAIITIGPNAAPFYTACFCAAYIAVFVPPLSPSFRTRGRSAARSSPSFGGKAGPGSPGAPTATVQSAGQAGIVALCLSLQPTLLYLGINYRNILHPDHLWSVALLLSGAILFLHLCPKALWWMPDSLYWPRAISGVLAFIIGVAALETRVVAVAFGAYVKLHAPWSWVVVTIGLYLGGALVVAYFGGLLPLIDPGIVGVACIAVCTAGGLSIGLPLQILPFALFAGAGAAALLLHPLSLPTSDISVRVPPADSTPRQSDRASRCCCREQSARGA